MPRFRTVALLMLVAGLSLGVFAAKAVSFFQVPRGVVVDTGIPMLEQQVRLYQQENHLDASQAELVRRELIRYDEHIKAAMWQLRHENADWFEWAAKQAETRLQYVLEKGIMPPSGYGVSEEPKLGNGRASPRPPSKGASRDEPKDK